jgi:hypothetical protein
MSQAPLQHRWRFVRVGGFDQVQLDTGRDLLALGQLDQKLWVALSCPIDGLEFDRRTLELIDADHSVSLELAVRTTPGTYRLRVRSTPA